MAGSHAYSDVDEALVHSYRIGAVGITTFGSGYECWQCSEAQKAHAQYDLECDSRDVGADDVLLCADDIV